MTDNLKTKVTDAVESGRIRADEALRNARAKASDAASVAKTKANDAIAATKSTAQSASEKTVQSVEKNPLAALIGGLAIGAIAAALLPRTEREDNAVGSVGTKLRDTASNAVKSARASGMEQLDALGVNSDAAKDQLRGLVDKIAKAATSAAEAAGDSLKRR